MKIFLILLLLFSPILVASQTDSCNQYRVIIKYLKSDSLFEAYYEGVSQRFKVDDKIRTGGIWPGLVNEYIAERTGVKSDTFYWVFVKDSAIINPIRSELEWEERFDFSFYIASCLSNFGVKRNAKIKIDFYRKHDNVVVASSYRIFRKPRAFYGMNYLFFFNDKSEIVKVNNAGWLKLE